MICSVQGLCIDLVYFGLLSFSTGWVCSLFSLVSSRHRFISKSGIDFHRKTKLTLCFLFLATRKQNTTFFFHFFFFFVCLAGNWLHFMSTAETSCLKWITFWPWMLLILCPIQLWGMTCKSAVACCSNCTEASTLWWAESLFDRYKTLSLCQYHVSKCSANYIRLCFLH